MAVASASANDSKNVKVQERQEYEQDTKNAVPMRAQWRQTEQLIANTCECVCVCVCITLHEKVK